MSPYTPRNLGVTRDARGVLTVLLDVAGLGYNVLNEEVLRELQTLAAELEHDATARVVLFRSAKQSGFLFGADLRQIRTLRNAREAERFSALGQQVFESIEHLGVPTVAAIHGPCLGGGLELALACRYRVARDDAQTCLAAPEVGLGLMPVWGGTQRLPPQIGVMAAVDMILGAKKTSAREAADIGLVDAVFSPERFDEGLQQFVHQRLDGKADGRWSGGLWTRLRDHTHLGHRLMLSVARHRLAPRDPDQPAPAAAWEAIEQGIALGREAGLARERRAFAELLFTPHCRRRLAEFFNRRTTASNLSQNQEPRSEPGCAAPEEPGQDKRGQNYSLEGSSDDGPAPNPSVRETPWVDGLTVGQVLRQTARRFGSREALVFPQADVRITWAEFDQQVDRVARGLLALGFQRGDHLGVWSTNWPEWVILQFATARVGVVLVTINPAYRLAELQYTLVQSEVRGLALVERFRQSDYAGMLRSACPEIEASPPGQLRSASFPHLEWVVAMRGLRHPGMLAWSELEAAGRDVVPGRLEEIEHQLQPGDPINLQYTSGTTGSPKGALLSHRNLLLNAYYASDGQRLDHRDRICIPVPLYHCFGCVLGTMCAVVRGATMVFPRESFEVAATLDAIQAERCTAIYGVPTMFIAELEHPSFAGRDLSSLRTGIMAGSPCPIEIMKRVEREMGAREMTIAYGQTEAAPLITMTRTDDPLEKRVGTVGRPLSGIEVKIVDMVSGREVADGQPGELCCRGHNVMLGYYHMTDLTAQAIDAGGWLHTGDLGLRQPDGYFRITGRIKDVIIRGGENIAPREIEELLYQHPKVEVVAVVGVPDRKFGEEILVWIKLRAGQQSSDREIRDYCRAHLAHFKTPRYVKFVDSFPTTVTGKLQKYKIRQQAIEELGLQQAATVETA